jgi:hypothetical protein
MDIYKKAGISFAVIIAIALGASIDFRHPQERDQFQGITEWKDPDAKTRGAAPAPAPATPSPTPTRTVDYIAKPLPEISLTEQAALADMESKTALTLNRLIDLSQTDTASYELIQELDSTKDPVKVQEILEENKQFIYKVNQLMTYVDYPADPSESMVAKGITDPEMANQIGIIVEYMVFSTILNRQLVNPNYNVEVVPGSFRTENGKTIIPDGSIYVKDDFGGIVGFVNLQGTIVVEKDGNLLNFDNYRNHPSNNEIVDSNQNWVTDEQLFHEFNEVKYTYSDPEKLAEYLNRNFKYGGTFSTVDIKDRDYLRLEHPASLLGANNNVVFYRIDD